MKLLTSALLLTALVNFQVVQCGRHRSVAASGKHERLRIDSLYQSSTSGLTSPVQIVVRNGADWQRTWARLVSSQLTRKPPLPSIDFTESMVVVVGTGSHPYTDFTVRADSAVLSAGRLSIYLTDLGPGPGCMSGAGPSWPAVAVRIRRRSEPVHFETHVLRDRCKP